MTPLRTLACLVLAALAGAGAPSGTISSSRGAARVSSKPIATVALERIFERPRLHLGERLRVVFQLRATVEHWNPYLTRFGTEDYVGLEVWGDDQFLWQRSEFENPLGLLFVRRGSEAADKIVAAEAFQRFEADVRVEQFLLGLPWMEIDEVRALEETVGEGTILHASRALKLLESGRKRLAIEDLNRALVEGLPDHAWLELERLIRHCRARSGSEGG